MHLNSNIQISLSLAQQFLFKTFALQNSTDIARISFFLFSLYDAQTFKYFFFNLQILLFTSKSDTYLSQYVSLFPSLFIIFSLSLSQSVFFSLLFSLFLTLSLSHTHIHTHTHTLSCYISTVFTFSLSLSLSLFSSFLLCK